MVFHLTNGIMHESTKAAIAAIDVEEMTNEKVG